MRVLLSCGAKTDNILTSIERKFQASGDEFLVVNFITDIDAVYSKGDYFDKAIITEQSITKEYQITDEDEIRARINRFAQDMKLRNKKVTFTFLVKTENIANMIQEEYLPIARESAIVVKEPPYAVTFMSSLIITDIDQYPSDILYKPAPEVGINNNVLTEADVEDNSSFDDMNIEDSYTIQNAPNNLDAVVGGNDLGVDIDSLFDGIDDFDDFDDNTGFDNSVNESNEGFGDFNDSDNTGFDDFGNNNNGEFGDQQNFSSFDDIPEVNQSVDDNYMYTPNTDNNRNNSFSQNQDENIEFEQFDPMETSTDAPELENIGQNQGMQYQDDFYNENQDNNNNYIPDEQYQPEEEYPSDEQYNTEAPIPGFDDTEDSQMYNNYTPDQNDRVNDYEDQGDNFNNGQDQGFYDQPQDQGMYDQSQDDLYNQPQDNSMYDQSQDDLYNQPQDNSMYTPDGQDFYNNAPEPDLYNTDQDLYAPQPEPMQEQAPNVDLDLYGQEVTQEIPVNQQPDEQDIYALQQQQQEAQALAEQQQAMLSQPVQQPKKKGLFGFGKKNQPQPVPQAQPLTPNMMPQQPVVGAAPQVNNMGNGKISEAQVRKELQPFAARGNGIVVTGCGGCGTSTIAFSLANIINQLGFTVLLVDFDTEGRAQNYISKLNYNSMEPDGANLMAAVNSSTNFQSHISVVKRGFHLLTMGLGSDVAPVSEMLQEDRIQRFLNLAKSSSNFIIYDVPFNSAKGFLKDVTYRADNLVLTVDASNWGVTKTMLSVCNIEENDMQDIMFNKAQIVFNRFRNLNTVFGRKVKTAADIEKEMDHKVIELLGEDPGFHFSDMHIAGVINDDPDFENGWFADVAYSDTKKGQDIFLRLIENIVLKK
jgi:Mrp family chromosome partitioning ATPase